MTTATAKIKKYISSLPEGQAFPSTVLRQFATTENIRQVLNRLARTDKIKRVARGIFVKPERVTKLGTVLPSASEVAKILANSTGETIITHGSEAARQLQLTTQVPMHLVFYTSGNTRTLKLANRTVKLIHVNPSKLIAPKTRAGLVISALRYLGRENVTTKTITTIKQRTSSKDFTAIIKLIARMPSWMADIFYRYQQEHEYEQ